VCGGENAASVNGTTTELSALKIDRREDAIVGGCQRRRGRRSTLDDDE